MAALRGWTDRLRRLACIFLLAVLIAMVWFQTGATAFLQLLGNPWQSVQLETLLPPDGVAEIGAIATPSEALALDFTLKFEAGLGRGFPNLLQTSPLNNGIRIEQSDRLLVALVANPSESDQPLVAILSNNIVPGQQYNLVIRAMDENYATFTLDDVEIRIDDVAVEVGGTDVRLGIGFDNLRKYDGSIRTPELKYLRVHSKKGVAFAYWTAFGLLAAILSVSLYATCRDQLLAIGQRQYRRRRHLARSRDDQTSLGLAEFFALAALVVVGSLAVYKLLSVILAQVAVGVLSDLLPGYTPTPAASAVKLEFIAYVLSQIGFVAVLVLSWVFGRLIVRQLRFRLRSIWFIALIAATISGFLLFAGPIPRTYFALGALLAIVGYMTSLAWFERTVWPLCLGAAIELRRLSRSQRLHRAAGKARVGALLWLVVAAFFGTALLAPAVQSWYPTVIPNDYYEAPDTFVVGKAGGTMNRDALAACLVDRASRQGCADTGSLLNSLVQTSYWQGASGRTFFHHSYIYVPAKHLVTYGFDGAVPYLYGYGNTMLHALLMASQGGTLSSYFATYPVALLFGMFAISLCVGYCGRSAALAIAAFVICLFELYSVHFSAALLAASFSPARYVGISLQIASIFFCVRGRPWRAVAIPIVAAFSLFWNLEFAALGLVGQGAILLAPQLRLSVWARLVAMIGLGAIAILGYWLTRTSPDIVVTIFLGLFQVNIPAMTGQETMALLVTALVVQGVATLAAFSFCKGERAARFAVLPMIALTLIKAIFNPSAPHMAITLAFILPMTLLYLPSVGSSYGQSTYRWLAKLVGFGALCIACWNAGLAYQVQAMNFRVTFITPFVAAPWTELDETVPMITPETLIVGRVDAIADFARPEDTLLVLSPFDHLLAFYMNPVRFCGHFELLTNVATKQNIEQTLDCVARAPSVLVVYDQALALPCPDLSALGAIGQCSTKMLAKANLETVLDRLRVDLKEVGRSGSLIFYRLTETTNG